DLRCWVSDKTGRGPLVDGWRNNTKPIMCSYKRVECSFEVYGFQGRTEDFIHKVEIQTLLPMTHLAYSNIRDILLVGHRQAVAWVDEWHGMSLEGVREFEKRLQQETNSKLKSEHFDSAAPLRPSFSRSISVTDESSLKKMGVNTLVIPDSSSCDSSSSLNKPMRMNSTSE
ncbi:hypothetical protein P4O66_010497, partial [Electrophorus voltai]